MLRKLMVWAGVALAAAWAAAPAAAQSRGRNGNQNSTVPAIKFEFRWWNPMEWEGTFGADNDGLGFSKVHAQSDLDMDDEVQLLDFRASIGDIQAGWIEFTHFSSNIKGEDILDQPITFEGVTFPAGTTVQSQWSFRYSSLVLGQLYGVGAGYYLGYEIGAAEYSWRARVRAPLDGLYAAVSDDPSIPIIGIQVALGLGSAFKAFGVVRGNFLAVSGSDAKLLEGFIEAQFRLATWMSLHLGWRYLTLDSKFDLNGPGKGRADFLYQGPYIGLELRIG